MSDYYIDHIIDDDSDVEYELVDSYSRTKLQEVQDEVYNISVYDWRSNSNTSYPTGFRTGRYDTSGVAVSSSHQIRSIKAIKFPGIKKFIIDPPEGFSAAVIEYNENDSFVQFTGATLGANSDPIEIFVTEGHSYNFAFGYWNESITNEDLTNSMVDDFVLTTYSSKTEKIDQIESIVDGMHPMELSAESSITIADNSDLNDITSPNTYKITNNTHAATMSNLPVAIAGKLVVSQLSQAARIEQIYTIVNDSYPVRTYTRYFNGSSWSDWRHLIDNVKFDDAIENLSVRKMYLQHESGSFASGKATERLNVYLPAASGYILYRLYHFIDENINCNSWQIYHAYHVDDYFANQIDLSITGEWECAIKLNGKSDFSGGHTHGDEVMTNVVFLVDGVPTTISSLSSRTECKELRIIETSKMYDPDGGSAIATHGREYIFDVNGLVLDQSLTWLVAEQLDNCYLAMFLPSKNVVDRACVNSDFNVLTLASSTSESLTTIIKNNANAITMWDTAGGFSCDVSVPVYPTGLTGGDRITISDNSGGNYNKVYFKICGGGSSSVGELWKSKTIYKLNYKV